MMMLKRDDVTSLLYSYIAGPKGQEWEECCRHIIDSVGKLPCWPAPNPEERDGRNIMGQTEEQFWAMVDRDEVPQNIAEMYPWLKPRSQD